jgi:hypothetical protein
MFGLLSWLWDRASRVYEFFGTLYSRIKDAAVNAYNWARTAASDAYKWSRDYLLPRISDALEAAKLFVWSKYWDALEWIENVRLTAYEWLLEAKQWATDKARAFLKDALAYAEGVKALLILRLYDLQGHLETWVRGLFGPLQTEVGALSTLDQRVTPLISVLEGSNLGKIADFLQNGYAFVSSLLDSPLAVLWSIVEPKLSDLGSYYLGYALGAVNRTLAPPPNLLGGFIGGDGGGGLGPPPGAGRLAPPLDGLYVSGYTFWNPPGHEGIDFGLKRGQTVYAAHSGVVEIARDVGDGYAGCVTIRGGDWWTRYAHLMGFYVREGDHVVAREPIAQGDSTGNSTGDHLHFAVRFKGQYIDPVRVL